MEIPTQATDARVGHPLLRYCTLQILTGSSAQHSRPSQQPVQVHVPPQLSQQVPLHCSQQAHEKLSWVVVASVLVSADALSASASTHSTTCSFDFIVFSSEFRLGGDMAPHAHPTQR